MELSKIEDKRYHFRGYYEVKTHVGGLLEYREIRVLNETTGRGGGDIVEWALMQVAYWLEPGTRGGVFLPTLKTQICSGHKNTDFLSN
jgi:hypothetical protein